MGKALSQPIVKVFFHIAAFNNYHDIIADHMTRLIFSGVYDRAETVFCFIVGPSKGAIEEATQYLKLFGQKVVIANTTLNYTLFERFTLLGLKQYLEPGDNLLYIHTKGVSTRHHGAMEGHVKHIYFWALYMDYWLMYKWEDCLAELQKHDVVGVKYVPMGTYRNFSNYGDVPAHFSGNFFWSTADHFLSLQPVIGDKYFDPEFYVTSRNARYFSMHQPVIHDTYAHLLSPDLYMAQ